jgi:hypothetical protein
MDSAGEDQGASRRDGSDSLSSDKRRKRRGPAKAAASAASSTPVYIPSYLRSRFGDRGSALRDQPSSRNLLSTPLNPPENGMPEGAHNQASNSESSAKSTPQAQNQTETKHGKNAGPESKEADEKKAAAPPSKHSM